MKKARIMLAVIAVLGLVGGTLAFKAQRYFTKSALYATTTATNGFCYFGPYTTSTSGVTTTIPVFTTFTTSNVAIGPYYGKNAAGKVLYCTSTVQGYFELAE
jgi:hypothetical protein